MLISTINGQVVIHTRGFSDENKTRSIVRKYSASGRLVEEIGNRDSMGKQEQITPVPLDAIGITNPEEN